MSNFLPLEQWFDGPDDQPFRSPEEYRAYVAYLVGENTTPSTSGHTEDSVGITVALNGGEPESAGGDAELASLDSGTASGDSFDPGTFRRASQGGDIFKGLLPQAYTDLLDLASFPPSEHVKLGSGVRTLGDVATTLLIEMPKQLEVAVVHHFSNVNGLMKPTKPSLVDIFGPTTTKSLGDFDELEKIEWRAYMHTANPMDDVPRDMAVFGLGNLRHHVNNRVLAVSKYAYEPGESRLFDRSRKALLATPFALTETLLPDYTAQELETIFHLGTSATEIMSSMLETAHTGLFEADPSE
jgi:hypothetical protein